MFGIAWGVGSLLLLVGLGEGFRSGNRKQFDSVGENVMFIWSGRAPVMQGSFTALRQYYLTYRDYQEILAECPSVAAATPVINRNDIRAVSDFYQASGQIMGVLPNINQIRYIPINEGRWINAMDDAQKRTVIVIGDEVRRTLFPGCRRHHSAQWCSIHSGRHGTKDRAWRQHESQPAELRAIPCDEGLFPPTQCRHRH
jgi:putative ABC transport system permease protein